MQARSLLTSSPTLVIASGLLFIICLVSSVNSRSIQLEEPSNKESTIRQIHVLFRHGERMPTSLYPTDPNKKEDLPVGLGRITNNGKREQYDLGKLLRQRYDGFLTTDTNEVKARSSGRDRCLESIQANLAGLYAPKGKQIWNNQLNWNPVPVQTMPVNIDGMLYEDAICKNDDLVISVLRSTGEGQQVMDKYGDLMKMLQEKSGKKMNDWVSVRDLLDTIKIEKSLNLKIPEWVTDEVLEQMEECAAYTTKLNYIVDDRIKYRAGLVLKDVTNHMKAVAQGRKDLPKIFMYASHDVLVAAYLSALGVFNKLHVPPSTSVVTELHQLNEDLRVRVFFRNETAGGPLVEQNIPTCDNDGCSLIQWNQTVSKFIPEDWREECDETPLPEGIKLYDEF